MVDILEIVAEGLRNVIENGDVDETWTNDEIACDMLAYYSEVEDCSYDEVLAAVIATRDNLEG